VERWVVGGWLLVAGGIGIEFVIEASDAVLPRVDGVFVRGAADVVGREEEIDAGVA
jgi:hypothetical protein